MRQPGDTSKKKEKGQVKRLPRSSNQLPSFAAFSLKLKAAFC